MSDRRPSLVVVSGPSGAGKSTILAHVLAEIPDLRFSVSHTTRQRREDEAEGVDYHFVTRAAFEDLRAEERFLEWAEVHGQCYGTSLDEYDRALHDGVDLLLDLDVQGAAQVRARFPDAVSVFILPPSYADLEHRLRHRGSDDEASFRRRLATASEEVLLYDKYDYVVINEDVFRSVESLKAVVRAARCRTSRVDALCRQVLRTFPVSKEI